ncbi:MAG: SET domain-containing protein-lysine N-methyltransferase [Candidatus Micrarchaeia archaeon]
MGFNWTSSKIETRASRISGKGMFSKERIRKDELIAAFGGHVFTFAEWEQLPDGVKWLDLRIHEDLIIGPRSVSEIGDGDHINHSCDPNAGIRGQIILVAMRDIDPGEEVTFDYSMVLFGGHFRMECHCGSASCRRLVTSDDWKKSALQLRYSGYFSSYLQEKIDEKVRPSRS